MNTRAIVALAGSLAVAGAVHAQRQLEAELNSDLDARTIIEPPPAQHQHQAPADNDIPGNPFPEILLDHDLIDAHDEANELGMLLDRSEDIFDAVLVDASLVDVPGLRVLTTEYTFAVTEWFKGHDDVQFIRYRETGGYNDDGSGMASCQSHQLTVGERYLVFGRPAPQEMLLPFERVLRIENNRVLIDENGHPAVVLFDDQMIFGPDKASIGLRYFPEAPDDLDAGLGANAGPPQPTDGSAPPIQPEHDLLPNKPINVHVILDEIRSRTDGASPASGTTFSEPSDVLISDEIDPRYIWCGWWNTLHGFYLWAPDATERQWFFDAETDWNHLVQSGGSGGSFLMGHFNIFNRSPTANNGDWEAGYPSSTQMILGGYGSWAANGNPSGITFWWWTGNCGRFIEADAFTNPSNVGNQLQFRKTTVHELGHTISLGHVLNQYGIMVSGTWRVPPNYVLGSEYLRRDDYLGGRATLNFSNSVTAGTWVLRNFADLSTYSQTEEAGSYVMTTLTDYSLNSGQAFTVDGMHVDNRGRNSINDVSIKFYLSTNTTITTFDTQIGSGSWSTFNAEAAWWNGSFGLTVPSTMPSGTYYFGWILTSPNGELHTNNNTGIMRWSSSSSFAQRTVTVTCQPPSVPSGVAATDGVYCSGVNVTWSAAAGAIHYDVYRNTSSSTTGMTLVGNNVTSPFFDTSGNAGQTYYYRVRTNNGCGAQSGNSAFNTGYRANTPNIVSGVAATDGTVCGKVRVTWNGAAGATLYSVYRNTINSTAGATFVVNTVNTTYDDDGGSEGVTYYYWIRSWNTCGYASYSFPNTGYYFNSDADLTTTGAAIGDPGYGLPDGQVTGADINFYVNAYVAGDLGIADITTQGAGVGDPGYGVRDGLITAADINFYVNLWNLGCF